MRTDDAAKMTNEWMNGEETGKECQSIFTWAFVGAQKLTRPSEERSVAELKRRRISGSPSHPFDSLPCAPMSNYKHNGNRTQ